MSSALTVRPLDLGDDAELAAAHAVESAATSHVRPGWVPMGEASRLTAWRADDGWHRVLVGAFDGAELVGIASAQTAHDTPDTCWVDVAVHLRAGRKGLGMRLARAVEDSVLPDVSRFVASAYRPTTAAVDELVHGFARSLGYTVATTETVVELDLTRAELADDTAGHHTAYAISTHVDGVPAHLRADVGVLTGLVDAEAPNGELDWQPTPVSVEEYAAEIALRQEQGRTTIESVAVDADGAVVAWTGLVVAPDPARPAQIEGTLVLADHRGHRLGRAVKVASLRAAREHGRAVRVRTSSDDANVWMRAINAELGFVPVESEVILHRRR
ncbi:GNAT family N-acetyltransferase [Terrabacter sp. C0L_2]|uniref:GNAT family N-acetyltransferase n=1 Tax=Terrabacter sp. C0L_2 TaxID=3108389 RepID=UPI002ED15440|nr:GNAT family N-acetyltransferase [Terrabacter sp. C0L_2]